MSDQTLITINTGLVANDGTGESLRDAFDAVNDNFANIWQNGPVNTQVTISNNRVTTNEVNLDLIIAGNGIANVSAASHLVPNIDGVYTLGSANRRWDEAHALYYYGNARFLTGLSRNILENGNSNVAIQDPNGPVTIAVDGTANVAIFDTSGITIAADLLPAANTVSLGNAENAFENGYFSGQGVYIGNASISANATAVIITNAQGGEFVIDNTGTDYPYNDSNVVSLLGNLDTDISTTGNVTAQNFIGNISGNLLITGANTGVVFNDAGVGNATTGFTFDKTANAVSVSGNITSTGNVQGTYFLGNGTQLDGVLADRGGDSANWNTMTQMGVYTVNRLSWAGTSGTPLDSQVFVGLLEIKNSTGTALEQIFYPGTVQEGNVKIAWNRTYWGGSWSAWYKIINDDQVVSGGVY